MDRIQAQFTKLTQLLFDPKTIESYQTVVVLTWHILKETAILLWLTICSVFVLAAWIGENAIHTGRNVRTWVSQQSDSEADSTEKAAAVGQALLDVSQNGANYLLNQAREQLGLEKLDRPVKVVQPTEPKPKAIKEVPVTTAAADELSPVPTAKKPPAPPEAEEKAAAE